MAPKIVANPAKQATILAWFHKSAVAHSIKDLEKALPQVASINGMQVKDYLQSLSDDSKIRVEKIGSGNWYWSFPSDEKHAKESALVKAQEEYNKANEIVTALQQKIDEAGAARNEDEAMLNDIGMDRKALITKHADLTKELEGLKQELAAYSEQDPVEVEKKKKEMHDLSVDVERYTDHILSMEGWLKEHAGGDPEVLLGLKSTLYGEEFDEEIGGLRAHNESGHNSSGRRGGRGRGRGPQAGASHQGNENANSRGRGRGRGGQARGNRDGGTRGGRSQEKGKAPVANVQDGEQAQAVSAKPNLTAAPTDADAEEGEVCFICASPVQHLAVAPCNHRTCHICSLRLRALYKTKTCAHCRTESDHVVFTDNPTKNYEEFAPDDFFKVDDNLGIRFETAETFEDTRLLLQYNCPDGTCDVACLGWPDLHRHVKTAHGKVMCDLCSRNKKVFTHEHELFTYSELKQHQKFGDDNPGAIDQSGFKGHPECGFCRQRDKHERCHICDRRNEGRNPQYYVNYEALEQHFRKDHFMCPDRECLEKKFAHQLEAHPNGLTKDALRDARRVNMSGFDIRGSHDQESSGRRDGRGRDGGRGRGRGRGRDPNAEPIPASSAQPMSRAELAYQRTQAALQNGSTGRAFGGQLTSGPTPGEAFAARAPPAAEPPPTMTVPRPAGATVNNVANSVGQMTLNNTPGPQTPQDQARLLRHNAVTERAANMLRNDQTKLQEFRSQISTYRNNKATATELIEGFFALFDANTAEIGKLIKELAEIFEIQTKREGLLKAWSDWKAINEDYPSLPGSAMEQSLRGGPAAHGGSRVLKLKSSTAQSSRSAVNKQASWNSTASNSLFPPLPAAGPASRIGAKPGQTPWASSSASAASASTKRASPMPSRAASSTAVNRPSNAELFPALPTAPKPTSTIFSPGYSGSGIRRDNSGRNAGTNAWTGVAASSSGGINSTAVAEEANAGNKKKGNKNKKQTLFHFG
ncbi:hypothetical protein DM02DRAFT_641943 [Periconia macrospinosa]|uniref:RING-type E3 ubiquitin transferase n=1 Tax=Periconia macrospinosa TaxID=97972 RepID=A0A2V1DT95_9PLEO|nr:hypothetical protein DM02DRAFT_641943 [Periconia macrospinosa]